MAPIYFYLILPLLGIAAIILTNHFRQKYSGPFLRNYHLFILFYYTYGCLLFIGLYATTQIFQRTGDLINYSGQIVISLSTPLKVVYLYFALIWIFQIIEKKLPVWLKVSYWIIQAALILRTMILLETLPEVTNPAGFNPVYGAHFRANAIIEFVAWIFLLIAAFLLKSAKRRLLGKGLALIYLIGSILFLLLTDIIPPAIISDSIYSIAYVSLLFFAFNIPAFIFLKIFLKKNPMEMLPSMPKQDKFREFAKKFQLTPREEEIIQLIMQGKSNSEIAEKLFISIQTVKNNIWAVFQKTNVKSRGQLTYLAQTHTASEDPSAAASNTRP